MSDYPMPEGETSPEETSAKNESLKETGRKLYSAAQEIGLSPRDIQVLGTLLNYADTKPKDLREWAPEFSAPDFMSKVREMYIVFATADAEARKQKKE